jgi:hypothetical protein
MLPLLRVLGALGTVVSIAPATAAAAQRYAGPNGSGTACTSANQCSIRQAIEAAGFNDEVIVAPGDYSLTTTLQTPYGMTIHGVGGQPRPRLLFSGTGQGGQGQMGLKVLAGSTLRYLEVDQANDWPALTAQQSLVDQVVAKGSGAWTAEVQNSTLRDSIVLSSGTNNVALETDANGAGWSSTYRNVTAIATGSGGVAIQAWALTDWVSVLARNVIARGGPGGHSIVARASTGATATITVGNSDWQDYSTDGAGASVVDGGANIGVPATFVDAAAGDYRQAAGSPTIDAGLDEFLDGSLDSTAIRARSARSTSAPTSSSSLRLPPRPAPARSPSIRRR